MASLLYASEDQQPLLGPLQITPPDAGVPDIGQGAADIYNKVTDYISRQQAESARLGYWDPQTGLPTSKGLLDAAQQYSGAMVGSVAAPGEGTLLDQALSKRVSTRIPKAVGTDAAAIHAGNDLQINTDAISNTSAEQKAADKLRGYADVPTDAAADNAGVFGNAVQHFKDNLRWIYDNMIPAVRDQAAGWYDGAHTLTGAAASQYSVPHEAVAGMTARLSPGTDWNQNWSMTKRMLDIDATQQDAMLSPAQHELIQGYIAGQEKPKVQAALQNEYAGMANLPYRDMSDMQRAMFIRSHDEAKTALDPSNGYYPVIHPEGYELGNATKADKVTPTSLGWQSLDNISGALSMLRDSSPSNISINLGDGHKIRSFYNNIIEPNSPAGDVTVDTHQIAASHMLPLGISHPVVEQGMRGPPYTNATGSAGLYGVYADAVRSLASDLNLLPRQVQSITWEGVRGLFPAAFKRSKGAADIAPLWSNPDAAAARNAIGAARGITAAGDEPVRIPAPDWFTPGAR